MSDSKEPDMHENDDGYECRGLQIAAIGAFFSGASVALGAFGSHGLKKVLSETALTTFHTGVEYQMYHGLALFALGLAIRFWNSEAATSTLLKRLHTAAQFLVAGTLIFPGTLYIYSIFGLRLAAMITPIGGVLFLIGWFLIVLALLQKSRSS
jgi:uncharacterized membrane protein YgdD (TMEM256/DUF423 family)